MISWNNSRTLAEAKNARRKPHFVLQILIFILVFLASSLIAGLLVAFPTLIWLFGNGEFISAAQHGDLRAVIEIASKMPDWIIIVQLFATVGETACAMIYCRCIERRSGRSMGFARKGWLREYLLGYLVGAGMILAVGGICVLTGSMHLRLSASLPVVSLLLFFVGYLVQGMAEEVLVRGYFMVSFSNSLKSKHAAAIAVGVSSLLFAALHLSNPGMTWLSFLNLLLAGVFFAVYILRTDRIWGACAAHSAWNFFQGNILGAQVSGLSETPSVFRAAFEGSALIHGGSFGLEGGLAVTIVQVVAILLVLFLPKKTAEPI